MNKKLLAYIVLPILGLAVIGTSVAFASMNPNTKNNPMDSLVSAIAKKFNLNSNDVQTVVDQVMTEQRQQMQAERTQEFKNRIAQLVTDKKLTQEQADKIIAKHAEEENFGQSLQGKTQAEIKTAMEKHREEMQQWATDNNIPMQYMQFGKGPGEHGGPRGEGQGFGPHGLNKATNNKTTK